MASVDLLALRTRARQRADMENSRFVSDSELNTYINASIKELYDLLIASRGENYYVTGPISIDLVPGTSSYPLEADFYKLLGVDWVQSTTEASSLKEFKWQERNFFRTPFASNEYSNLRYQIRGNNIVFIPTPNNGQNVQYWYIPQASNLTSDDDTFDGINGWEEYVIIDAAIKMRVKEESPVDYLILAKQEMKDRIKQSSQGRDSLHPSRVVDVDRGYSSWF
jgi:hypothetical protein